MYRLGHSHTAHQLDPPASAGVCAGGGARCGTDERSCTQRPAMGTERGVPVHPAHLGLQCTP
eukprot:6763176-Alexandrium_andersonii.AAC.1